MNRCDRCTTEIPDDEGAFCPFCVVAIHNEQVEEWA